jgi:hypothetical protein
MPPGSIRALVALTIVADSMEKLAMASLLFYFGSR